MRPSSVMGVFFAIHLPLFAACQPKDANRQELDALRAEVERLKAQVAERGPQVSAAQDPKRVEQRREQLLAKIRADFERDFRGADQPELAQKLQTRFSQVAGAKSLKVDCKGELCRLETQHDSATALQAFKAKALIGLTAAWQGPFTIVSVEPATGQGVRTVTYLGKEPATRHVPPVDSEPCECAPSKASKTQEQPG